jgi:dolichol-phosphate mannosyltransferase
MPLPVVYICLPIYNEEDNLPGLFLRLKSLMEGSSQRYHIIAHDDGSTDRTHDILTQQKLGTDLTILHNPRNYGLGFGLERLMLEACSMSQSDDDAAVFLDADDSHDPATIPQMAGIIREGADLVIASRYRPGSSIHGFPGYRRFLSLAASIYLQLMLHIPGVRDYTSGFRAYRVGALKKLKQNTGAPLIRESGFACQVELLAKMKSFARIREVPMIYRYDRKQGSSKMNVRQMIWRTMVIGLRCARYGS